jgi:hypothetical protein
MGIFKNLVWLSLFTKASFATFEDQRIQFLIAKKEYSKAIDTYQKLYGKKNQVNQEVLQVLGQSILEDSISSLDSKEQLLGLYGLMISQSSGIDFDFSKLIDSKDPSVQMLTIQYLSSLNEDIVENWLNKAMSSPYLPVRLQALGVLVEHKSKLALSHIESLYYRLPEMYRPIFAQYYAALGTPFAIKILKQMLSDPNPQMKVASLLSITQFKRDDFKEEVKKILSQPDPMVQESAIFSLAEMQDLTACDLIKTYSNSSYPNLKLAALNGLLAFHQEKYQEQLFELASKGDLYAIFALGTVFNSEKTLIELAKSSDYQIKFNAMHGLVEKKHPLSKSLLIDFFKTHSLYDGIGPSFSVGKTQVCLKIFPAFMKQFEKSKEFCNYIQGMTLMIRSRLLVQALDLKEDDFIEIAEVILENDIWDVIPTLVKLLENCHSEKTIAMLKKMTQKVGSPRTRLYSLIALARLKEPFYTAQFFEYFQSQNPQVIVKLQTFDTQETSLKKPSRFLLTPDEHSQVLLEAYETMVHLHDERVFPILLNAIVQSPKENKPVLAGLLLKALL